MLLQIAKEFGQKKRRLLNSAARQSLSTLRIRGFAAQPSSWCAFLVYTRLDDLPC